MNYRMDLPILALAPEQGEDHHQGAVTILANQIVEVVGAAADERFLVVRRNEELFHVFASDLASRGSQLKSRGNRQK